MLNLSPAGNLLILCASYEPIPGVPMVCGNPGGKWGWSPWMQPLCGWEWGAKKTEMTPSTVGPLSDTLLKPCDLGPVHTESATKWVRFISVELFILSGSKHQRNQSTIDTTQRLSINGSRFTIPCSGRSIFSVRVGWGGATNPVASTIRKEISKWKNRNSWGRRLEPMPFYSSACHEQQYKRTQGMF